MREAWTGELVGRMHMENVSIRDVAKEMACTAAYASMILNGQRNPPDARERMVEAFEKVLEKREGVSG